MRCDTTDRDTTDRDTTDGELLNTAAAIVTSVRAELHDRTGGTPAQARAKTVPWDVVTDDDLWTEARLTELVLRRYPCDGIVAEEGSTRPGTSGRDWVIDPIDGTSFYAATKPGSSISVAVAETTTTIAGVVAAIGSDTIYTAHRDGPALRNDEPIEPARPETIAECTVSYGFGSRLRGAGAETRLVDNLLATVGDAQLRGGAALSICEVADGTTDGFWGLGLSRWDVEAAALIARRSGVSVTMSVIDPGDYSLVASPHKVHRDMLSATTAALAAIDSGYSSSSKRC